MKLKERHDKTLIEEWRADLKRASTIKGWEYKVEDQRLEVDFVQEVVSKIFELANELVPLDVGDHIFGVKQVAENLIQTIDEKKVLMLGLWGMGGIGKSTLARELYNQLGRRFDAKCYVGDVADKVNQDGVSDVQNHIMKALCDNGSMPNTLDKWQGKGILERRLSRKRILLVLDDVRDDDHMGCLMSCKMLKEGSLCIITSQNRRVFEKSSSFPVNAKVHTHEVQLLGERDSQSVFECHAFGGDRKVPQEFVGLVGDVSKACGGVPLVLEVCGSRLKGEKVEIWEEVLEQLNCGTIMDETKIFKILRISYDSLEEQHQEMFLDIACALLGASVEMAKLVWKSHRWRPALGVEILVEKALIRVEDGKFWMHNHLRDLGCAISQRSSLCRHLWGSKILAFLEDDKPLPDSLETLVLPWRPGVQVDLSLMKRLRILKWVDGFVSLSSLPDNLRWLELSHVFLESEGFKEALNNGDLGAWLWNGGSIERFPESFGNLRKLEVLNLSHCRVGLELPNSIGGLENLKHLDLKYCAIESLPASFGCLRKLEVLNLSYCRVGLEFPNSIGGLENLKHLDLKYCAIESLPASFGCLRKLEVLDLAHCSRLSLLPASFGGLQNLKNLILFKSGIQCLPKSLGLLKNLAFSNIAGCSNIPALPDSIPLLPSLQTLNLGSLSEVQKFI